MSPGWPSCATLVASHDREDDQHGGDPEGGTESMPCHARLLFWLWTKIVELLAAVKNVARRRSGLASS